MDEQAVIGGTVETTRTMQKAGAKLWGNEGSLASSFAEVLMTVASVCVNYLRNLYRWRPWGTVNASPTENRAIKLNSAVILRDHIVLHSSVSVNHTETSYGTKNLDPSCGTAYCNTEPPESDCGSCSSMPSMPKMLPPVCTSGDDDTPLKEEAIVTEQPVPQDGHFLRHVESMPKMLPPLCTSGGDDTPQKEEAVVIKQPVAQDGPFRRDVKEDREEVNNGCCVSCCGFSLECCDGIIP